MGIQQHESRKTKGLAAGIVQRIHLAEVFAGHRRGMNAVSHRPALLYHVPAGSRQTRAGALMTHVNFFELYCLAGDIS